MTGKRRKRDNWIWNCFQTRLLMLQIPVEGVGSCPVHVSFSWGPPRSRVISRFCWYREVRDLNFSDHVKHKKALKLYIILILKTSALRFFLWFFFFGLKLTRYHAIGIPQRNSGNRGVSKCFSPTGFWPFKKKRKIHISRSMAGILTNKPLIGSSDNVV